MLLFAARSLALFIVSICGPLAGRGARGADKMRGVNVDSGIEGVRARCLRYCRVKYYVELHVWLCDDGLTGNTRGSRPSKGLPFDNDRRLPSRSWLAMLILASN